MSDDDFKKHLFGVVSKSQQVVKFAGDIEKFLIELKAAVTVLEREVEYYKSLAQKVVIGADPLDQEEVEDLFPESEGWRNDGEGWTKD